MYQVDHVRVKSLCAHCDSSGGGTASSDHSYDGWMGQGDPGLIIAAARPSHCCCLLSSHLVSGTFCQDDAAKKLCDDKSSGEMFRLKAGKENCRDVVQCTAAVCSKLIISRNLLHQYFPGLATNPLSSRSGFWSGETDLWLEGCCQQLWPADQGAEGEASVGHWRASVWWPQQTGLWRRHLYCQGTVLWWQQGL